MYFALWHLEKKIVNGMKGSIYQYIVLLSLVFIQVGCASIPGVSEQKKVFIAPKMSIQLPDISDLKQHFEFEQMITATYDSQKMAFQNQISFSPEKLLMVFYDPFGRASLTIQWDKKGIEYTKSASVPQKLLPENILADFVMMNWPPTSIQNALKPSGAHLIETKNHRQIVRDGKVLIDVQYASSSKLNPLKSHIIYHHIAWGYTLDIQSVRQAQ